MHTFRYIGRKTRKKAGGYLSDDKASSTIEFVLWVPVFVLILGVIVDVSFFFLAQSRMFDAAADATRRWAVGSMTQAEAESFAATSASFKSVSATAVGSSAGGAVTITISMSSQEVAVVGVIPFLASDFMTASVTQVREGF